MTRKTSWNVCATTASPRIATASQTRSPRMRPPAKATAPSGPRPITRATSAAIPGPGDAAATSKVLPNRTSAARFMRDTPYKSTKAKTGPSARRHFEHRTLTMVCMAHGNRQRIGGVVRARIGLRQQHPDHHANLRLLAVTDADDRLLHLVGCIFGHRQAGNSGDQHGDAARLA